MNASDTAINGSKWSLQRCEYIRLQARTRFDKVRSTWQDLGSWAAPHRARYLFNQGLAEGQRVNRHIVDTTHITGLRSFKAGFLEGNTSASRPWFRHRHKNPDVNADPANKEWMDLLTRSCLNVLSTSNFYHAAGQFYSDFGVFNTGAHYFEERNDGYVHFHTLTPGGYFIINNGLGVADILIREFTLTVQALIDTYGKKDKNGQADWSNFSARVKKLYDDGNLSQKITVVHIIMPNDDFNPSEPVALLNKQWISLHYELGSGTGQYYVDGFESGVGLDLRGKNTFLRKWASKRKPFVAGRADSSDNFEYGETGPTLDALGLIKSLNKKAISKDIAIEQIIQPAVQGPANLRKSYISTASRSYVPLDAQAMSQGGIKPITQFNPSISILDSDIADLRRQVSKIYYEDYLTYLSMNPKTRTATEANAVVQEQQLIIGPLLQSLNTTYNNPIIEFVTDYVLFEDPDLPPPPPGLQGQFLRIENISVFASAQRAADLPAIDRYVQSISNLGQLQPQAWDKLNVDKYADLIEDRLYLPAGLNNPKSVVDAKREQAQAQAQRQQMINEHMPALAGAAKDMAAARQSGQ